MPTEAQQLERFRKQVLDEAGNPLDEPRVLQQGAAPTGGVDTVLLTEAGPSNETRRVFCLGFDALGDPNAFLGGIP